MPVETIEGTYNSPQDARFGIVAARFNEFIVDRLLEGALATFRKHGVDEANITVVRVPGAFEIPVACKWLADSGRVNAIIGLGCVIRGATAHFEYVSGEAAKGLGNVALTTGVPTVFGVLTTDTIEQAVERAGTKAGNKGSEAALSAIEMASIANTIFGKGSKARRAR